MMKGAVVAQKLLDDGVEIGTNVSVELPELSIGTTDYSGSGLMGTLSLPTTGQFESMEATVNTKGLGADTVQLMRPGKHKLELRFVQDTATTEGDIVPEGAKVFMTCVQKSSSGGSVETPNAMEGAATFEVIRYQMFVNGQELFLIDKTNYIYRVGGTDYAMDVRNLLN